MRAAFPSRTPKTAGAAAASPSRSARISVNASAPAITAARTRIRTSTSGSTPFPYCCGSLRSEKQETIAALSNAARPHPSSSENSAFVRRPTASNQRIPTDSDLQPFVTRCFARLPCHCRANSLTDHRRASTSFSAIARAPDEAKATGGRSSMVERKLPKLHTRVRFPSPAPALSLRALLVLAPPWLTDARTPPL